MFCTMETTTMICSLVLSAIFFAIFWNVWFSIFRDLILQCINAAWPTMHSPVSNFQLVTSWMPRTLSPGRTACRFSTRSWDSHKYVLVVISLQKFQHFWRLQVSFHVNKTKTSVFCIFCWGHSWKIPSLPKWQCAQRAFDGLPNEGCGRGLTDSLYPRVGENWLDPI